MAITVTRLHKDEHLSGGAALAMDSFDGLHLGQVQIIEDARVHALKIGAPLAVLSYEPSPFRLMNPHMGPLSIITRDQEIEFLSRIGVDILYILTFDFTIMRMSHSEFSRDILHNALGVRHISAPAWIAYGKDRLGRQGDLRSEGERYGFSVSAVDASPAADGAVISTHGIRDLISQGRMDEVVSQLGRPYAIKGSVQHGAKLGRTIGFPTANIALSDYVRPAAGIYASISQLQDGRRIPGLSYIARPARAITKSIAVGDRNAGRRAESRGRGLDGERSGHQLRTVDPCPYRRSSRWRTGRLDPRRTISNARIRSRHEPEFFLARRHARNSARHHRSRPRPEVKR